MKVIHVHLIFEKKDYYFGSIAAIYDIIDENTIAITRNTLSHKGLTYGSTIITKRAIIKQSKLITSKR